MTPIKRATEALLDSAHITDEAAVRAALSAALDRDEIAQAIRDHLNEERPVLPADYEIADAVISHVTGGAA